jgi:uncharacterized protein YacL
MEAKQADAPDASLGSALFQVLRLFVPVLLLGALLAFLVSQFDTLYPFLAYLLPIIRQPVNIAFSVIILALFLIGIVCTIFRTLKNFTAFLPTLLVSLGVLGTFIGIFIALLDFDTTDITASIPSLLDGMKTAFYTSIIGMLSSLILKALFTLRKDIGNSEAKENQPFTNDAQTDSNTKTNDVNHRIQDLNTSILHLEEAIRRL